MSQLAAVRSVADQQINPVSMIPEQEHKAMKSKPKHQQLIGAYK